MQSDLLFSIRQGKYMNCYGFFSQKNIVLKSISLLKWCDEAVAIRGSHIMGANEAGSLTWHMC